MYTYLIIDDEPLIRKGTMKKISPLSDIITCCGEADNGKEGIELTEKLHPDIIILDMQMPIMDGMQLLPYLSSHYPDTPLIVISGYQNFDYIKQAISSKAIDYILKPFSREEIQKVVLSAIDSLQNKQLMENQFTRAQEEKEDARYHLDITLLSNLIMGYETPPDRQFLSQRLNFINQAHDYMLFTLYFHQIPSHDLMFQKWFDKNNYHDIALYLSHAYIQQFGFILLFVPEDCAGKKQFTQLFLNNLLPWLTNQNLSLNIGISHSRTDLSQLHKAFTETTEALDSQKVASENTCFLFSEDTPVPITIFWEKEEEFLFRIESGDTQKVLTLTEQLFAYYSSIAGCTLSDVKRHCAQISSSCRGILNYYLNQQEGGHEPSSNMQSIVNTLFSLEDLKNYYLQFFLNVANMLKEKSVYTNNDLVDQIRIYMTRNYQKNLTQEFIASLFYLNRSYLSQLFKKKTGEKFIDYLNNIRIEKSKELLVHTDKKMYTIAKSVGYDNSKYFFRIFKKKTGLSPEKYRELNQQNNL